MRDECTPKALYNIQEYASQESQCPDIAKHIKGLAVCQMNLGNVMACMEFSESGCLAQGRLRKRGDMVTAAHREEEKVLGAAAIQAQVVGWLLCLLGQFHCCDKEGKGNAHRCQHHSSQRQLSVGACN